jgi:redox-sensitive bicupin YhaK (pirin superfamily)
MNIRTLQRVVPGIATSDGAGVKLRRSLGGSQALRFDPFLMLDEFSSYDPVDYLAGFPSHPHRGFETVTYMLDGRMRHEDHLGNRGDLGPGDVQWMTAARGIIHSEMPQQIEGRLRGFQLWINLPARDKMKPAAYRDIPAGEIPAVALAGGGQARVILGELIQGAQSTRGPAKAASMPGNAAGLLGPGDAVRVVAGSQGARFLLIAGRPIGEPVVQYGPFVMNTRAEIDQAITDYQSGRLAAA